MIAFADGGGMEVDGYRDELPDTLVDWVPVRQDDFGYQPTRWAKPSTTTQPGSKERINLLAARVASGQPLFVHGDRIPEGCRKYIDDWTDSVRHGTDSSGMLLSRDGMYCYRYWQYWSEDRSQPVAGFLGLNPPTSNDLDPTRRKLKSFAMRWGCRGFEIGNLFALRADRLSDIVSAESPVGLMNDRAIVEVAEAANYVVCCWGVGGSHLDRSARVVWSLKNSIGRKRLHHFGLTQKFESRLTGQLVGQPKSAMDIPARAVTELLPIEEIDCNDDSGSLAAS